MATYTLFNRNITFLDCNENFFEMQHRAWVAMDKASGEFDKWYEQCGNILSVLKGYEDKSTELIVKYATMLLQPYSHSVCLPYKTQQNQQKDSSDCRLLEA